MAVAIINDCRDDNARARQELQVATLMPGEHITFTGVKKEIEASGNLIDQLGIMSVSSGVMLVNKAPRNGNAKRFPNGTPFGFFRFGETFVVSSIDGLALSLVKKLKLVEKVYEVDIPTVVGDVLAATGESQALAPGIINTQFRSLKFTPRLGAALFFGGDDFADSIDSSPFGINEVPDAPLAVSFIDCFGNGKTSILPEDIGYDPQIDPRLRVETSLGILTCYPHLAEVPDQETALTIGSSGIGNKNFMEVVIQGGKAAKVHNLAPGFVLL